METTYDADGEATEAPQPSAEILVAVSARASAEGWSARIVTSELDGERRERALDIAHPSCDELVATVVLVIALLLEEHWAGRRTLQAPVHAQAIGSPPPARPVPEPTWVVDSALGASISYGDLPALTGGLGLAATFAAPRALAVSLRLNVWPHDAVRNEQRRGARFSAYDIGLGICPRVLQRKRAELFACAGAAGGIVQASGRGLVDIKSATRPRALATSSFGVRIRLAGAVWGAFGIGATIPLIRDRYRYFEGNGTAVLVHRAWPVCPTATFDMMLRSRIVRERHARRSRRS